MLRRKKTVKEVTLAKRPARHLKETETQRQLLFKNLKLEMEFATF